jgi:anaerobic selenocysteine-containing dehydrogenase
MDEMTDISLPHTLSRRNFMKSTAALAMAHSVLGAGQEPVEAMDNRKMLAYVGAYTIAVDGGANGEGIYRTGCWPRRLPTLHGS